MRQKFLSPFWLPVYAFGLVILAGALLLRLEPSLNGVSLSFVDALFTATSAVCVTGLAVVDTPSTFSTLGRTVLVSLIQLGGLGIMTYSSLIFFLLRRRVSLTDKTAVGQVLLHDPSFDLGRFLLHMIIFTLCIELAGAAALMVLLPHDMPFFYAVFHSISAFCNAGFALFSDSLMRWHNNAGVNVVFMLLIILGGLGFSVLEECLLRLRGEIKSLSRHTRIVLRTSFWLIFGGAACLLLTELHSGGSADIFTRTLHALFQSVTARTAGFNTVDIGSMANVSLLIMLFLMFVGGSPGSCAGGIKTTTLRALGAFVTAQLMGRRQVVLRGRALDDATMNKALTLFIFAVLTVAGATLALSITESSGGALAKDKGMFLELLFEAISAFATVGLSTGLTADLTPAGKLIITFLMFVGRIGPIWLLTALQRFQNEPKYRWPETQLPIG
ncbi:TrkH family potassium uptake protein [Oleidesulfovibrio sp.]|uniref:TrkH family potassium uptake protein n=1 Tax=Oleidesulfovibrio sp. TaxID=2909707 RepID=UPI003A857C22